VLSFRSIAKRFGATQALRDVSLDVRAGEIFGLLGPNGAGKTTLIRVLLDVVRPDAGTVELFGAPRTRAELDRVTYLPEEARLYKRRRVLEVMTYLAELKGLAHREARRRSADWLERIGLAEAARWKVERLSKGNAQKVQLAVALLPEPDLCVLDEPFSGLDPVNARWLTEVLAKRRANGQSTIVSTHEMGRAEKLCDRIGLVDRGRLAVCGTLGEIRTRFGRADVDVETRGRPPSVAGVESIAPAGTDRWRIALAPGARPSDVLRALVLAGAEVHRFEPVEMPLEEIFLRVVAEGKSS